MADIAKILMTVGVLLFLLGVVMAFAAKIPWLGKLPGDILIKKDSFTFYFPLVTCVILSLILTALMMFFGRR